MNRVEIIRAVCDASEEQLKAIEKIVGVKKPACAVPADTVKRYRIQGKDGYTFVLSDGFSKLTTFKNGKPYASETITLRAATRGYMEMLLTHAGCFIKRSSIEKHLHTFAAHENVKKFSGRTSIRDVFRYTLRGKKAEPEYAMLSLYNCIESISGWDPEYCIPAESVTVLRSK